MANPSTTGPSGVGTEVLRRSYYNNLSTSDFALINGDANHIYTVLSVVFSGRATTAELLSMFVVIDGGSTDIHLMTEVPLVNFETFVWNDKIVLTGTDELKVIAASAASIDVYCTFIDQQFAAP